MNSFGGAQDRASALVLTAGLGTRLRPLTFVRAKAAVPVNGEPLARRVARWLASHEYRDQVFNLHHHPASIAACLGDGGDLGIRLRYSWEQPVLGSAGGPRHALPLLTDGGRSRFLIVNGDTLTNVDLAALDEAHARSGALVTMALIANPAPEKYGGVLVHGGYVRGFTRAGSSEESFHFVGVQLAEARAFAALEDGVPFESVNWLYPRLLSEDPHSIGAFVSGATFRDIGTPADCLRTSHELAAVEGEQGVGAGVRIDPSAVIVRSSLWDDVTIEAGARLTDCIVADGVRVPAGSVYERSAIVELDGKLIVKAL
jgi:mannose-1-phosphate guanylyltransferase